MVYLQQDAFDNVDATVPLDRQKMTFKLVYDVTQSEATFEDKENARKTFTQLTGLMKNFHYAADGTPEYKDTWEQVRELCREKFGV